ncbi:MAG: cell division protein ZapE [Formosimonas sp.]
MKKNNFTTHYLAVLAQQGYQPDSAQMAAAQRLQKCEDDWAAFKAKRSNQFLKFFTKPQTPVGVYLWGGVGRGKSVLMDTFYAHINLRRKIRIHFHEFMLSVHTELAQLKGMFDPLDEVARRVSERYRLICFDEFHVSDIADAMILHRLLDALVKNGVGFIMTSNYKPDDLYPNGLHRDRILPAIDLIKHITDVCNVDAGIDYRHRTLAQATVYLTPNDTQADAQMQQLFKDLAGLSQASSVHINHRDIKARGVGDKVAWFDFDALCSTARSQTDYLALIARFHTIMVANVPQLSAAMFSSARRFTWLIDVMYDHKIKLFISAATAPEHLYTEGQMANEFFRTVSRLTEMQSQEYLAEPVLAVKTL